MSQDNEQKRERHGWRAVFGVAATLVLLVVLAIGGYLAALVPDLPRLRAEPPKLDVSSIIFSADGNELSRIYREDRIWARYRDISPNVVRSLLATEDHRFYEHDGIDFRRTISAVYHTLRGETQGASTVTMQLARNLYPREIGSSRSVVRKLKEMMTAVKIERNFSKSEILEMYLNTVPFGNNAFGIESAARRYLSKSAGALEVDEAALLVGILKGTSHYDPIDHPERALERRNLVLQRMRGRGFITESEYGVHREKALVLDFQPRDPAGELAPHFVDHVRKVAGQWADANGYDLYADGLRIHTTLDERLQQMATEATVRQVEYLHEVAAGAWGGSAFPILWRQKPEILDMHIRRSARFQRELAQTDASTALQTLRADAAFVDSLRRSVARLEGGLVAIEPSTGYVKAWVGGRDYRADEFDKVAQAKRQPGSTFKPFVYTAAVDFGFSPYHTFTDTLVSVQLAGSNRTWTPQNSGGGASGADLTLRDALVYSKNTITTQLVKDLGPQQVSIFAQRMGIRSPLDAVPSIGLGTSETSLLEMTSAYGTIATNGVRTEPIVITRIEDRDGRTVARFTPRPEKALSTFTAYTVLDMMRGVISSGTGYRLRSQFGIDADVAGKTGTSQNYADGWFIMMHPRLVTGAWVGFNDRRITFRSSETGQGGRTALRLVGDFFADVLEADPALRQERFRPPVGYVEPRERDRSDPYGYVRDSDEDWEMRDAFLEGLEEDRWEDTLDIDAIRSDTNSFDSYVEPRRDTDPDSDVGRELRRRIRPVEREDAAGTDTTARPDTSSIRRFF